MTATRNTVSPPEAISWAVVLSAALCAATARASDVPTLSAGLGHCSADFTVTDSSRKPVYNAKIHVLITYGFLNKRRQELEAGTNDEGKARFEGLPDKVKDKPLEYHIRFGAQQTSVTQNPETNCHATFNVALPAR